jgi:hypothetical protein
MKFLFLIFISATSLVLLPMATMATSITVGDLEFNNLSVGVNDFTVNNFTGSNNLGFFPVADNVTFDNVVLMATESNGTVLTFHVGNLAPGTDTSAQVADSLLFTQIAFTATLDPSTFSLTNGSSGSLVANPTLSFTLLPSSGSYLAAGVDLGIIDASPVVTPEPSTISLFIIGLLGMLGVRARKYLTANRV